MESFKVWLDASAWSRSDVYAAVAIAIPLWYISYIVYQLVFHPLAKIPGPKLAAITTLYEGYIDVSTQGRYLFEIEKWHRKYGPIVRVGPNEVHVNDPSYYDELYNGKLRLDKYEYYYKPLTFPPSAFGTIDTKLHRVRRSALNPFFSVAAVSRIHPLLQKLTDRLCERMSEKIANNEAIPLFYAFRCITVDLITEYSFGERFDLLERPDWGRSFYHAFRNVMEVSPIMRQLPFLPAVFMNMPRWLTGMIDKRMLEVIDLNDGIDDATARVLKKGPEDVKSKEHPTVVWQLVNSDALPAKEKEFGRIKFEANTLVTGGMETTSATLTYTIFQILNNPEIHARLLKELEDAIPDPSNMPQYAKLQELPYLTACIKEGLRLSFGGIGRLPRCSRNEPIIYKEHIIPKGSGIGMSPYFIHLSPTTFPSPHTYDPTRWLSPTAKTTIERHLIPFSRGPRMCVGINLAHAELYTLLANILRRFPEMKLWKTTERDVEVWHDYFAAVSRHEGEGLMVRVGEVKE